MKRALLLAGLSAFVAFSAARAETETLGDYVDRLVKDYGRDATVTFSIIDGYTAGGQVFQDSSPPPLTMGARGMTVFATQPAKDPKTCEQLGRPIIDEEQAGPYLYRWCWSDKVAGGTEYEAKMDAWAYFNGRVTYIYSQHFDCENTNDLASMPQQVKLELCF